MHVSELALTNVRQFQQRTFSLQPGFNLLVGENGAGKTTVLRSLFAALAPKKIQRGRIIFDDDDIRLRASEMHITATVSISEKQNVLSSYHRSLAGRSTRSTTGSVFPVLSYASNEATCSSFISRPIQTVSENREISAKRREERQIYEDLEREERHERLGEPTFGDSRPLREFMRRMLRQFSPRFKDFAWSFEPYSCAIRDPKRRTSELGEFKALRSNLRFAILRHFQEQPRRRQIDRRVVRIDSRGRAVVGNLSVPLTPPFRELLSRYKFATEDSKYIGDLVADVRLTPRITITAEHGRFHLRQLSDGEQRLFSILVDIARQLMLQRRANEDFSKMSALILIDEIDVHLHPKWQRMIIPALKELFPNCQFVATTHSPFVIQAVDDHQVQHLDHLITGNFQNRGIEEIAAKVMGIEDHQTSRRYLDMLDTAREYFRVLESARRENDAPRLDELKQKLKNLSHRYADNPAYEAYLEVHGRLALGIDALR